MTDADTGQPQPTGELDADAPDDPTEPAEATQLSVLPMPQPDPTGVPSVDAALERLAELDGEQPDAAAHVEVFEDVHTRLQEALGSTDAE